MENVPVNAEPICGNYKPIIGELKYKAGNIIKNPASGFRIWQCINYTRSSDVVKVVGSKRSSYACTHCKHFKKIHGQ